MNVRTALKTATAWAVACSGYDAAARERLYRGRPFIAGYHRVVDRLDAVGEFALPSMEITVSTFERHIEWMGRHFEFFSLEDLASKMEQPQKSKPLAALTFDDGYSDVYHHAFPLLKRKGIPATVFVVTNLIDSDRLPIHEELYAALVRSAIPDAFRTTQSLLQRFPQSEVLRIIASMPADGDPMRRAALRPLTTAMLKEMHAAGVSIGSHSKTHAFLTNEGDARVREELEGSRRALTAILGTTPQWFAYPGGSFDARIVRAVAAAGYRYAVSDCRCHVDTAYPLLTLPRKGFWERSCLDPFGRFSPAIMSCHSAEMFDSFSRCSGH